VRVTFSAFIIAILLIPVLIADFSEAECCESSPVTLHMIGPADTGFLTPFSAELGNLTEVTTTNSISEQTVIASWSITPAWLGDYPEDTWEFTIPYSIENAGGAQINATITIDIGSTTYSADIGQDQAFLAAGDNEMNIDIEIDGGAITSGSIEVTLSVRTLLFNVPASEASLTFMWGTVEDDATLNANIPLLSMVFEQPDVEGMDVYIHLLITSPWGQAMLSQTDINLRVDGITIDSEPNGSQADDDAFRLTWTWSATESGDINITTVAEIVVQKDLGNPAQSISQAHSITTIDDGSSSGGGFYTPDEPLQSNGAGSPLAVDIRMDMYVDQGSIALEREVDIMFSNEMSYWLRWGLDNIGSDSSSLSDSLRIFSAGSVKDEHRRNRVVDEVETSEFERQMVTRASTFLQQGMGFEGDELLGRNFNEFETINIEIDLMGDNKVSYSPISMKISTLEVVEEDKLTTLVRDFIIVQPANPRWQEFDLTISVTTDSLSSLTGAAIKGDDSIKLSHVRYPWGEKITVTATGLDTDDTFSFVALATNSPLHSPLPLTAAAAITCLVGFWIALRMTKNRVRKALWMESSLFLIVATAIFFAYPPFTIIAILVVTIALFLITAVASPKRTDLDDGLSDFPLVDCPACTTGNPITSDERPLRIPCGGCGKVLRIVS
jgi:hypothetical protein